jgi:hypothetical protein
MTSNAIGEVPTARQGAIDTWFFNIHYINPLSPTASRLPNVGIPVRSYCTAQFQICRHCPGHQPSQSQQDFGRT